MPKKASYLLDEEIIPFYPTLAKMIGVNKAIMLQQLHFLLNGQRTAKNEHNHVDGEWWVYNSYKEWQRDHFIWLSTSAIKKLFNELEADGFIISRQSVKYASDRRKWYRIDYDAWEKFTEGMGQNLSHQSLDKIYPINGQKVDDGYSTTSTNKDKENPFAAKNAAVDVSNASVKGNPKPQTPKTENQDPPSKVAPKVPPRDRDPIFDAVAEYIFGVTDPAIRLTMQPDETPEGKKQRKTTNTRISIIKSWLKREIEFIPYGKSSKHVGFISGPATVDQIKQFATWYKVKTKDQISMVLDGEKFVDTWRKWASEVNGRKQRQQTPAPSTQPLTDAQRQQRQADIAARRNVVTT